MYNDKKLDFGCLSRTGKPLLLPGAHDALSARMIEDGGFAAYGIGGSALSATQLAMPDVGLQSFGEYRDGVMRIMEGSRLPLMVDGENGFGDAKAVTRTVRSFEKLGVAAIAFEDLVFPPPLGRPPAVIAQAEMEAKLNAALAAREDMLIIGRTDAAYAVGLDEAIARAKAYAALGVDGLIVPGLAELDAYKRLRAAVAVPIIAVVVPGSPWYAPSQDELAEAGIEAALYPAAILWRIIAATAQGLEAIRSSGGAGPDGFDPRSIGALLKLPEWAAIDGA
jgi:2-methylisocitrate lyase-like PEP mutase family enzyme